MRYFKKNGVDLKEYYTLFLETGLILSLLAFLVATKIEITESPQSIELGDVQEVVQMEEMVQTEQIEKPPPPPRPPVPVAVPNDEVIADEILNIDAELNLNESIELPPPPPQAESEREEDFFIVVEEMPHLKGGLVNLQQQIRYPEKARKAGIEGRVIVQFIITEKGEVEDPRVIRGIGGGCDEEALRVVKKAQFVPGRQRGKPVRVQYTLPIVFRLAKS